MKPTDKKYEVLTKILTSIQEQRADEEIKKAENARIEAIHQKQIEEERGKEIERHRQHIKEQYRHNIDKQEKQHEYIDSGIAASIYQHNEITCKEKTI